MYKQFNSLFKNKLQHIFLLLKNVKEILNNQILITNSLGLDSLCFSKKLKYLG